MNLQLQMPRVFRRLAAVWLLLSATASVSLAQPSQVTPTWLFPSINAPSNGVLRVVITPIGNVIPSPGIALQTPITATRANWPNLTNGYFTTNVFTGVNLKVDVSDALATYTTNYYFPTNVSGALTAAQTDYYKGMVQNGQFYYSTPNLPLPNSATNAITNLIATFAGSATGSVSVANNTISLTIGASNPPVGVSTNGFLSMADTNTLKAQAGAAIASSNYLTSASAFVLGGITSAYQTNALVYPVTVQTNTMFFYGSTFTPINTNFFWNTAFNAYTNKQGSVNYYLAYTNAYGWYIQTNTPQYDGSGAKWVRGNFDFSINDPNIANLFESAASGLWADFAVNIDAGLFMNGALTNTATNSYAYFQVPVQFNLTTNFENYQIAREVNGKDLSYLQYNSNANVSFIAPRFLVESNAGYVVCGQTTNGGAGLQNYFFNLQSSLNTINPFEPRFAVGAGTLFGSNGMLGSKIEFLQQRDRTFDDSPQQAATHFWHPLNLNPDGSVTLGNNPTAEHTLFYRFTNGWTIFRTSTKSRPQLYLEPSPDPTNALVNGQAWNSTNSASAYSNRVSVVQNGVAFPIPQINTTNATLSTATSFTWKFSYPFSDTNYSVTLTGAGATLGTNVVIGAKTTTNVALTFPSFTGILNAIAAHQ